MNSSGPLPRKASSMRNTNNHPFDASTPATFCNIRARRCEGSSVSTSSCRLVLSQTARLGDPEPKVRTRLQDHSSNWIQQFDNTTHSIARLGKHCG
ncbi:hypothetical protein CEXT_17141 [Caerostris extrusa]|uniref:Uncharacterized protein n=1 Tax=Caerostris extrusa TaxID=172846 RepID=A0AAV4S4G6_CAEEX|nr:hypothetical protein CEXT_17141 [Caerostris extrusa]